MNYHKGTALGEIARSLNVPVNQVFAAGGHLADLPMLERRHAGLLAAPANALAVVKATVLRQQGFVSERIHGYGVAGRFASLSGRSRKKRQFELK